jgi:hypothetical protein
MAMSPPHLRLTTLLHRQRATLEATGKTSRRSERAQGRSLPCAMGSAPTLRKALLSPVWSDADITLAHTCGVCRCTIY